MDKLSAERRGGPVCHPARYRPSPPTLDMGTEGEGGGGCRVHGIHVYIDVPTCIRMHGPELCLVCATVLLEQDLV